MQKGIAPILIVMLIAFGIGGYFVYQKQSMQIAPLTAAALTITPPENFNARNSQ